MWVSGVPRASELAVGDRKPPKPIDCPLIVGLTSGKALPGAEEDMVGRCATWGAQNIRLLMSWCFTVPESAFEKMMKAEKTSKISREHPYRLLQRNRQIWFATWLPLYLSLSLCHPEHDKKSKDVSKDVFLASKGQRDLNKKEKLSPQLLKYCQPFEVSVKIRSFFLENSRKIVSWRFNNKQLGLFKRINTSIWTDRDESCFLFEQRQTSSWQPIRTVWFSWRKQLATRFCLMCKGVCSLGHDIIVADISNMFAHETYLHLV
jgi:hypothetical protein